MQDMSDGPVAVALLTHILAGGVALVAGAVALVAAKGANLHRKSGRIFFYSMLTMSLSGAGIAVYHGVETSVIAGLLAAYLVITALTTVRPPSPGSRRLDRGAAVVAFATGLASVSLGLEALGRGVGSRNGVPVVVLFVFGVVALLSSASDIRILRSGLQGTRRLTRHLWRMCFALFLATGSFFLGQADEFPDSLRIPALLALLALAPLGIMVYWLWRVRNRPSIFREAGGVDASAVVEQGASPLD